MKLMGGVLMVLLLTSAGLAAPPVAILGAPPDNAFVAAAAELGLKCASPATPDPAAYGALLLCAPAYPQVTALSPAARQACEAFLAAGKTVYLEYTPLAGVLGDQPRTAAFERLLVTAEGRRPLGLQPMTLLEEHISQYLPPAGAAPAPWLSYGRVAGLDQAVFGAPPDAVPALYAVPHGGGKLLVATTALSNAHRGRYKPSAAWQTLLQAVLLALLPEADATAARRAQVALEAWTEPREWVAPGEPVRLHVRTTATQVTATGPQGRVALQRAAGEFVSDPLRLPEGEHRFRVTAARGDTTREGTVALEVSPRARRYAATIRRNLRWFEQAGMLSAPDGSLGVREGLRSELGPEGKPRPADGLRVDCVSECGLLFALYGRVLQDAAWGARGRNMLRYTGRAFAVTSQDCWYFGQWQSRGEFREDGGTVYVFNDDSGAGTLFALLGYAETGDEGCLQSGLRGVEYFCHVASAHDGLFFPLPHRDYEGSGRMGVPWPVLRQQRNEPAAPHVMSLPLASLLVAYQLTGEGRYLEVAEKGIRTLMARYPDWHLVTSRTCEHARMLLPLALLQHVAPTAEHRRWLDTVTGFLLSKQAPCGALMEWDGYNPASNAAFGTAETSVFQRNGDPVSDQLYDTGFALLHLALAAQVTGDPGLRQAAERLGDYLSRIQLRDPEPRYDGTWLRAFDYGRWEYFGSSADIGWGPYCSETGWMCAPLDLGLLLLATDTALPGLDRPADRDAARAAAQRARQEADAVERALSLPPPATIGGLQARPPRGPYAELTWETPAGQSLTYHVHRSLGAGFAPAAATEVAQTAGGRWVDEGLAPGTTYHYRVLATNGLGQASGPGAELAVTTGPVSKARGCRYTKSVPPQGGYLDAGDAEATDGFLAGAYRDGKSFGYRLAQVGDSLRVEIVVDLGRECAVGRAAHHNCGAPGYRPDRMAVSLSPDGQTWTEVGATSEASGSALVMDFAETRARFVRFVFTKQRQGATDDWLFLDEVEVF